MTGVSQFTKILSFPVGVDSDDQFTVSVGGQGLGTFHVGQSVDFVALTGGPVPAFEVKDIGPLVDAADSLAFPIQLEFDQPTADRPAQVTLRVGRSCSARIATSCCNPAPACRSAC